MAITARKVKIPLLKTQFLSMIFFVTAFISHVDLRLATQTGSGEALHAG